MATETITLSPLRLEALGIVARGHPLVGAAQGMANLPGHGIIGWQQARWLRSNRFATDRFGRVVLTHRGRVLCSHVGIEPNTGQLSLATG